jgi:hypothetical protein
MLLLMNSALHSVRSDGQVMMGSRFEVADLSLIFGIR